MIGARVAAVLAAVFRSLVDAYKWRNVGRATRTIGAVIVATFFLQIVVLLAFDAWVHDVLFARIPEYPEFFWSHVTAVFSHDPSSLDHIVWNLVGLYFVGAPFERWYGARATWVVFLVGGVLSGILEDLIVGPEVALGASGGLAALLGAALVCWPRRASDPVRTLFGPLLWLLAPSAAFVLFWVAVYDPDPASGDWAHATGLLIGIAAGGVQLLRPTEGSESLPEGTSGLREH